MKGYIYKITSPSGKIYVGQTINIIGRLATYEKLKCKQQTKLFNSLSKYGYNNHTVEVIEIIEEEDVFTFSDKLNTLEIKYILLFDCILNGLNIAAGGTDVMKGRKHSDEAKKKISDANTGRIYLNRKSPPERTKETREKISNAMKGKLKSEEHKASLKISRARQIISEETKQKLSDMFKGRVFSEEWKEKIKNAKKGKFWTDEQKEKAAQTRLKNKEKKQWQITAH